MFLRSCKRRKNGKEHRYFSLVESRRMAGGKVVQRQVLYLGKLNDSQQAAWRKSLEVFDEAADQSRQMSLFPDDRPIPPDALDAVQVKLTQMVLRRPRAFGDCWLGCELWRQLELERFWDQRLAEHKGDVSWAKVLELLVVNRLIEPGSEFRLHRHWFARTAMDELLQVDVLAASKDRLYRCLDYLVDHKDDLFKHLRRRWQDLFAAEFDILLYDLTSTYFEGLCEGNPQAKHGYSRDGRGDCRQVVIALVVTPQGLPLAYEVMPGNTSDRGTLRKFLDKIQSQYGQARRTWMMDRGIPKGGPPADAGRRRELPGRDAARAVGQAGGRPAGAALAADAGQRAGQAAGQGLRGLGAGQERRPPAERVGHAAAQAPHAVGRLGRLA